MKISMLLSHLCLALTTQGVAVKAQDEDKIVEFRNVIAKAMEEAGIRGAAYAFRGPGMEKPVLGWFGQAGQAADSPLIDQNTAFMLASVSKPFTGAAVGVLVDRGIIALDDDICKGKTIGLLSTACRNLAYPRTPVTWRMLVTHRSSIVPDIPELPDGSSPLFGPTGGTYWGIPFVGNSRCPIDDVERFYADIFVNQATTTTVGQDDGLELNWFNFIQNTLGGMWNAATEPGAVSEYSNNGIAYVAALLPKVTKGTNFREFCKKNIFDPAGMTTTAWFREELPVGTVVAMPVYNISTGWEEVGHYCWANYADGQLYSTITDMAKWAEAQVKYGINIFWSNKTAYNDVYGCQEKGVDGVKLNQADCQYALSWFFWEGEGFSSWSNLNWKNHMLHNGGTAGISTNMLVLPEEKSYVIVLTNTDEVDVDRFSEGIVEEGMGILLGGGSPGFFQV